MIGECCILGAILGTGYYLKKKLCKAGWINTDDLD
jgi:hypothetical protein